MSKEGIPEHMMKRPKRNRASTLVSQAKFLKAYAKRGVISQAARLAGVAVCTVYEWRKKDALFDVHMEEARTTCIESAEHELYRRALLKKPGERDTTALIFWLKKNYPDKYEDFTRIKFVTNEDLVRQIAQMLAETITDPETYSRVKEGLTRIAAAQ